MSNTADKVISKAKSEVGYLEKKNNSQLDKKTLNAGQNNYTKYWEELAPGMQGQPWCNCFINYIFKKAYGEKEAKKLLCTEGSWSYYTPTSASYFKNKGQWHSTPKRGDIIYFKNSQRICHVGLVYDVDAAKVYTIEGNTSSASGVIANGGGVAKKSYLLNYSNIAGYGRPKYDKSPEKKEVTTKKTNPYKEPNKIIKKGMSGENVKWVQWELNQRGIKVTIDGKFGSKTFEGVKKYQKIYKLAIDGIVGPKTKASMKKD